MPKIDTDPPADPRPPKPAVPRLQHVLEIAKRGAADPAALTAADIRDLSTTLLLQYAHMGIRSGGDD